MSPIGGDFSADAELFQSRVDVHNREVDIMYQRSS